MRAPARRLSEEANLSCCAQGKAFLLDLAACRAIIGTTALSLIADAIYPKRPYYGAPFRGQFEQTHNAITLVGSGLGTYSESPSREDLERFLADVPIYIDRLQRHEFDPDEQEDTLLGLAAFELRSRRSVARVCRNVMSA